MTERVKGYLKFFSQEKRYGFIESGGVDYFVHYSELRDDAKLNKGDELEFEIKQSDKGFQAINVIKIIKE